MTLDELIAKTNSEGWLVTELYQRSVDDWFAALRRSGDFTSARGRGATAFEAFSKACADRDDGWEAPVSRRRLKKRRRKSDV